MKKLEIKYTLFFFLLASAVVILITYNSTSVQNVSLYKDKDFLINILVEAHGMLLDLLLVGLVIFFFISSAEKKHEIKNLRKEIDYIRLLKTDEAKFKIKALIQQLNDLKIYDIDLHQCNLQKIDLLGIKTIEGKIQATAFSESNLSGSDFSKSSAERTFFIKSKLTNAKFIGCLMIRANFSESNSKGAFFNEAKILKCNFNGANLNNSDFRNSILTQSTFINSFARSCDFRNADLKDVDFTDCDIQSADFTGCINLTVLQIEKASKYDKIKLDHHLSSTMNLP